jgi:hypothetical protein
VKQSTDDSEKFLLNSDKSFSLSFFKKLSNECFFDEKSFDNLNDILINFLNDLLFLNEVFEIVNLIDWDVLNISLRFLFADEDLNCSYFVRRFFNHSTKFVASFVIARIAELKDLWFKTQSDDTKFFSTKNLKNLAMFFNNCLLNWANFAIVDKFEFWFTNCNNKWVCLIVKEWTINASNEVRIVTRELFTQNSKDKAEAN